MNTGVRVKKNKGIGFRYICEHCGNQSYSLGVIQKEAEVVKRGWNTKKDLQRMEESAYDSVGYLVSKAEDDMERGVENAIWHEIKIFPNCMSCGEQQSWAATINKRVGMKNIGVFLCIATAIISFILCIILGKYFMIPLIIMGTSIVAALGFSYLVPLVGRYKLKKQFDSLSKSDRPSAAILSTNFLCGECGGELGDLDGFCYSCGQNLP